MANTGTNPNPNNNVDHLKDIKVRITADIKDANKSLTELDRKVSKLGDLADQGHDRQRGFLSSKQVKMYKDIMKEIEQEYTKHQRRLEQIEKDFLLRKSKAQADARSKKKDLDDAVKRGIVDANPLTQGVYNHYKKRYQEADAKASDIENDRNINGQIAGLTGAIKDLETQVGRSKVESNYINSLHEQKVSSRDMANGISQILGNAGAVLSMGSLLNYTSNGAQMLRRDEYMNSRIGQKIGYGTDTDVDLRNEGAKLGEKNQYNSYETSVAQSTLVKGGYSDRSLLGKDTETIQQFGRAFAVDPNEIGQDGAMLKRIGALKDGEMQKFANLIAGSISKTKMNGREEEIMRSTASVLSQVSTKMVGISSDQMSNVVGLQTTIGKAIPTLNGERGAQMLTNMDSAIKNGDNAFDILMGKGTKYVGIEGQHQLDLQKEEGLSNPKNLQDFFQGIDRTGATDTEKSYMSTKIGLSLHEYQALHNAGLDEKFKKGDFSITDAEKAQLEKDGATNILDKMKDWDKTNSKKQAGIDSGMSNLQEDASKPYDGMSKSGLGMFNGMNNTLATVGIWGAGLSGLFGSGKLLRKGISKAWEWGTKKATNNVGQSLATGKYWKNPKDIFSGIFKDKFSFSEGLSNSTEALKDVGEGLASKGGSGILGTLANVGGKGIQVGGKLLSKFAKGIPVIGLGVDALSDRLENPENSWGRTAMKSIFGTIAGTASSAAVVAGSAALAPETLGGSLLGIAGAGAAGIAGNTAGSNFGDWAYSKMFGDSDKQKAEQVGRQKQLEQMTDTSTSSVPTTSNKSLSDTVSKTNTNKGTTAYSSFKDIDSTINKVGQDHNIKITIDGDIKGMTPDNQVEVKSSITNFWNKLLVPNGLTGIDLSKQSVLK